LAQFVGAEDAMLVSQGFATNSTTLPALVGKGALVISDEYNHNSIRFGTRLSGAMVRTYKHNDIADLERILRESISQGQPRRLRAWTKIVVVVEGIYSMEGSIVDLPNILRLKDKYKVR
jgi:serine palmitoyltransferase